MVKICKLFSVVLALTLLFSVNIFAEAQSWYCKRNSEHKQPSLDTNMRFIEDYGGYYLDRTHGDGCDDKVIYLTFDAGYENGNIVKILDTLRDEQVSAAFFVLEHLVTHDTLLVKRMAEEGHTVCNHTCSHKDMTKAHDKEEFYEELYSLEKLYNEYTGYEMAKYYRPPEGRYDEKTLKFAYELGYKTIFWSIAYADWDNNNQPSPEFAMKKLLDNIHNGAVILLHPTSATNAEILGDFIRELKAQGYRFGTLDELTSSEEMR